jgi:predicted DNA-binding transcriptional regulator AlpA
LGYDGQVPTLCDVETLVGNAELGKLLGVSRQRVSQLVTRDDFPAPRAVLIMGSVWTLDDVVEWADRKGRTLNLASLGGSSVKADGDKSEP